MPITDKQLISIFIVLVLLVGFTIIQINNFMPIIESCSDDFAVIEKCGCIPWNYSLTFPQYFNNKTIVYPNG